MDTSATALRCRAHRSAVCQLPLFAEADAGVAMPI